MNATHKLKKFDGTDNFFAAKYYVNYNKYNVNNNHLYYAYCIRKQVFF